MHTWTIIYTEGSEAQQYDSYLALPLYEALCSMLLQLQHYIENGMQIESAILNRVS